MVKRIGIFDSGVGGVSFAKSLRQIHPELNVKVIRDDKNMPYGSKSPKAIEMLTDFAIQPLLGADVVVLACNTATAYAIDFLRNKYPNQKFIGFEPALKTAASQTQTNQIAVLATPTTLKSTRYLMLKQAHGSYCVIFEPNVSTLAKQIETNSVSWPKLEALISNLANQNVDCIVLGCTHYHMIKDKIKQFAGPKVEIITPTTAVIKQIEKTLI